MLKRWVFLLCFVAPVAGGGNDLADFSNNLATDIGPLLALFGEAMTKQYLSECTSVLDYFIFSMAPIGILTAIVSVIRLCGHASLRAFIGRSQEGDGSVEAELCTSTGRDVCELFNKGGITRVLGRPKILELVHDPSVGSQSRANHSAADEHDDVGLFYSHEYLRRYAHASPKDSEKGSGSVSDWAPTKSFSFGRKAESANLQQVPPHRDLFAPHPNVLLNVGIIKRPKWVFLAVAAVGCFFQIGILALAAYGVWGLHWKLGQGSSASRDYAPTMYIVGTAFMCGGMFSCAAFIGQSTTEIRYSRQGKGKTQSRLLWLQPGPQVIGDQSFDPFAYMESTKDPLTTWTSSKKDLDRKFEMQTAVVVVATLAGYIMQFIGLRGMKAWISIAQLGITVVMSLFRGALRMQRLERKDNKLGQMPDAVAGHELDWLAFELARHNTNDHDWLVTGQYATATTHSQSDQPSATDQRNVRRGGENKRRGTNTSHDSHPSLACQTGYNRSSPAMCPIRVRSRLARLTGHDPFSTTHDYCQRWEDSNVKVRVKAKEVSSAICQAAGNLLSEWASQQDITLRIATATSSKSPASGLTHDLANITLRPPPKSADPTHLGWIIDSARMEAILGLWLWSLTSDHGSHLSNHLDKFSEPEKVQIARIVTAGPDNLEWHRQIDRQREMDLWLGPGKLKLSHAVINPRNQTVYSFNDVWQSQGDELELSVQDKAPMTIGDGQCQPMPRGRRRLCGWSSVYECLQPRGSQSSSSHSSADEYASSLDHGSKLRLQLCAVNGSLLDNCARELFAVLAASLAGLVANEPATCVEKDGIIRLHHPTITVLVEAFVKSGLGSHADAILCIVPTLGKQLPDPTEEDLLSSTIKEAETYRRRSEWQRSETLLRWACRRYCTSNLTSTGSESKLAENSLRATGELYRWALTQHSRNELKEFGKEGIKWMYVTHHSTYESHRGVADLLERYLYVGAAFDSRHPHDNLPSATDTFPKRAEALVRALESRQRKQALYLLCLVGTGDFGSDSLRSALPLAARNDWGEMATAMLELKADVNSKDADGCTALSISAKYGFDVRFWLDRGAFLETRDGGDNTPLMWAVMQGHEDIVRTLLLEYGANVHAEGRSNRTPLLFAAGSGHEGIVRLLLDQGADVNKRDRFQLTPFSWAAKSPWCDGHEAIFTLLLEHGTEIGSYDKKWAQEVLDHAEANGLEALRELILAAPKTQMERKAAGGRR